MQGFAGRAGRGCGVAEALRSAGAVWDGGFEAAGVVWGFKDCGGSGARGYGAQARAPSLHFFTFMGLIFVKYWVIMQM